MKGGRFAQNFIKLFSGTVLGQVLPILITPVLTRIYSVNEIGEFAIYFGTFSTFSSVLCLKMEQVIVVVKTKVEAFRVLSLTLKIVAAVSLVSLILLSLLTLFGNFWGLNLKFFWLLLPFQFFFYGIILTYSYFLNREGEFSKLGISKIIYGICYSGLQLLLFRLETYGLVVGLLVGTIFSSLYLLNVSKYFGFELNKVFGTWNFYDLSLLKKHKNYPLYSATNSLVNSLSNNIPLWLLGRFYNNSIVAYYSWSNRIIQAPMGFVIFSVHQLFYQQVAVRKNENLYIFPLILSIYKRLAAVGAIPFFCMLAFAPEIFLFIFGDGWDLSGKFTQLLLPWLFFVFLNSPITSIVQVLNRQKEYFLMEIILLVLRTASLTVGFYFFESAYVSIALFGAIGLIYNIFLMFYILTISKINDNAIKKQFV